MGKVLGMVPGTIYAVTRVIVRDPILLFRLGRILRLSGRCVEHCSPDRMQACMGRRLSVLQGHPATPVQQRLMERAVTPLRRALSQP